jgi:hypothetical protein
MKMNPQFAALNSFSVDVSKHLELQIRKQSGLDLDLNSKSRLLIQGQGKERN